MMCLKPRSSALLGNRIDNRCARFVWWCRCLLLVTFAGCQQPPVALQPIERLWLYPPPVLSLRAALHTGVVGRDPAVDDMHAIGILQADKLVLAPLQMPTVWQIPNLPLAVVSGQDDSGLPQTELIDLETAQLRWRDRDICTAPVVGVTKDSIVCADGHGVRALDLDGKLRWRTPDVLVSMFGSWLVLSASRDAQIQNIVATDSGKRYVDIALPTGVGLRGLCQNKDEDGGTSFSGLLDEGGSIAWASLRPPPLGVSAGKPTEASIPVVWRQPTILLSAPKTSDVNGLCEDNLVLKVVRPQPTLSINSPAMVPQLQRLDRKTGKVTATFNDAQAIGAFDRGWLVSTATMTVVLDEALAILSRPGLPPFETVLASTGTTSGATVLVTHRGQRASLWQKDRLIAHIALPGSTAAVGPDLLLFGQDLKQRSLHSVVQGFSVPVSSRSQQGPLTLMSAMISPHAPAPVRDWPAAQPLAAGNAKVAADQARYAIATVALDQQPNGVVYVASYAKPPSASDGATLSAFDAATLQWRWHRADGCGPGSVKTLFVTTFGIGCVTAVSERGGSEVRFSDKKSAAVWSRKLTSAEEVSAVGHHVLLRSGANFTLVDFQHPNEIGTTFPAQKAVLVSDERGEPLLIRQQGNALIAQSIGAGLMPLWSVSLSGVVTALTATPSLASLGRKAEPNPSGAVVTMTSGDAYWISSAGVVSAVADFADRVASCGDLLAAQSTTLNAGLRLSVIAPSGAVVTRNEYEMLIEAAVPAAVKGVNGETRPGASPLPLPRKSPFDVTLTGVRGSDASEFVIKIGGGLLAALASATGDPRALVTLPAGLTPFPFSVDVGGKVVTGVVAASPLRMILF
jgi:hypothetical protein